eukprot:GILJ01000397.1.p1 GENE.GILJ01000397.1~~GILJ01000397.1.p1  ORF type:complete len:359 (-),score=63.43 GILJ01000397.1:275-1240(-)
MAARSVSRNGSAPLSAASFVAVRSMSSAAAPKLAVEEMYDAVFVNSSLFPEEGSKTTWRDELRPVDIVIFEGVVCPQSSKVRAALDYFKLPYKTVSVNPLTRSQVMWLETRPVPIAKLADEKITVAVDGSNEIIANVQALAARHKLLSKPLSSDANADQLIDSIATAIPYHLYSSFGDASQTIDHSTRGWNESVHFNIIEKTIAKTLGAAYKVIEYKFRPRPAGVQSGQEKAALQSMLTQFESQYLQGKSFAGGDKPSLSDLKLYGVLSSIENLNAFSGLLPSPALQAWYARVKEAVGPSTRKVEWWNKEYEQPADAHAHH